MSHKFRPHFAKRDRDPDSPEPSVLNLPADLRSLVGRAHLAAHEARVARRAAFAAGDRDEATRQAGRARELTDLAHVVIRDRGFPPGWQEDLVRLMRQQPSPGEHTRRVS